VRGWDWGAGLSTSPKPLLFESRTNNVELLGNPGNRIRLKSCLTPFILTSFIFIESVEGNHADDVRVTHETPLVRFANYVYCFIAWIRQKARPDPVVVVVLITLMFAYFMLPQPVLAASFDCAKGKSASEQMVCSNKQLSSLDEILHVAYLRARITSLNESALKKSQREWLKVKNACTSNSCLEELYLERIEWMGKQPRSQMSYQLVLNRNSTACHQALNAYNKHINEEFPPPPPTFIQIFDSLPKHAPSEIAPHWSDGAENGTWLTQVDLDWDGRLETISKYRFFGGFVDSREKSNSGLDVCSGISPACQGKSDEKNQGKYMFTDGTYILNHGKPYPPGQFGKPQYDQIHVLAPEMEGIETNGFDVVLLQGKAYLTFTSNELGPDSFEDWSRRKWRVISRYLPSKHGQSKQSELPDQNVLQDICYLVLVRNNNFK
jgi:uncharacterized protein